MVRAEVPILEFPKNPDLGAFMNRMKRFHRMGMSADEIYVAENFSRGPEKQQIAEDEVDKLLKNKGWENHNQNQALNVGGDEKQDKLIKLWVNVSTLISYNMHLDKIKIQDRTKWLDLLTTIKTNLGQQSEYDGLFSQRIWKEPLSGEFITGLKKQIRDWNKKRNTNEENAEEEEVDPTWLDERHLALMFAKQSIFITKSGLPLTEEVSLQKFRDAGTNIPPELFGIIHKLGELIEVGLENKWGSLTHYVWKANTGHDYYHYFKNATYFLIIAARHKSDLARIIKEQPDNWKTIISGILQNQDTRYLFQNYEGQLRKIVYKVSQELASL